MLSDRPCSDDVKAKLLQNSTLPHSSSKAWYSSRSNQKQRRCKREWFEDPRFRHWLSLSEMHHGLYCSYCLLFGACSGTGKGNHEKPTALVSAPMTDYARAFNKHLPRHFESAYHQSAAQSAECFLRLY